jgi:hypothetical protein
MAITLVFRCPGCRARIKAPVQLIGKVRVCPGCAYLFVVPPEAPRDAGPTVLLDIPPVGARVAQGARSPARAR